MVQKIWAKEYQLLILSILQHCCFGAISDTNSTLFYNAFMSIKLKFITSKCRGMSQNLKINK